MLNNAEREREQIILDVFDLDFFYGKKQALFGVTAPIKRHTVTALIGPSGCGKSTFLRCMNRMNDLIEGASFTGSVLFNNDNILNDSVDVIQLRQKVGMVFQKSNPFPKSIFENVVYGLRIAGQTNKKKLLELAEQSLMQAALFDEVKDRMYESAYSLSGGQMQRLCIARAIAVRPEIILMDEPCSALDPRSTAKIEDLISNLKKDYTLLIVTHNMQQAARVSDETAFFYEGKLVEMAKTQLIFTNPSKTETEDYITGRFG